MEDAFRFCPHCGAAQRTKIVESFHGRDDLGDGALQVSAYLAEPQHVRFSIWRDERAEAVVSLAPAEGRRLARFLGAAVSAEERSDPLTRLRRAVVRNLH